MEIMLVRIANDNFKKSFWRFRESKNIKASTAFKMLQLSKPIVEHLQRYDETRKILCEKYAKRDEHDQPILVANASGEQHFDFEANNYIDFQREHFELLQEKIEIPEPKITIDDVKDIDLSIADLELLIGVVICE